MNSSTYGGWHRGGEYLYHDGHSIFVRVSAPRQENVLCIHGFPTSSFDYRKVWRALTMRFQVLAPDLIGYGFSAKPRDLDYTTFAQADLIEDLLRQLGVTRVHVLAHDYGSTITQELLARDEERGLGFEIASVCFLNGALFPETHRPILAQKLLIGPLGKYFGRFIPDGRFAASLASIFGPGTKPTKEELYDYLALFKLNGGKRIAHKLITYMPGRQRYRERWVPPLQKLSVPFLFINGSADPVSGKHLVDRFRRVVPGQTNIVELPDIGHFPHLECPERVAEEYLAFI